MPQYVTLIISTTICQLLVIYTGVCGALRCWQCSSAAGQFCGGENSPARFRGCENSTGPAECDEAWGHAHHLHSRAVCKKVSHRVDGVLVEVRSCGWDSSATYGWGPCSTSALADSPAVEFCGVCRSDGCNGAAGRAPLAAFCIGFSVFGLWRLS